MKTWIFLLFTFITFGLSAQVGITQIPGKENSITTHGQFHVLSYEVPILGSPYVNEIYKKGETLINGEAKTAALMRYDALNEAVEIMDPNNQKPRKLLRRKNIAATFDGKTYQVMEYKDGKKIRLGYFNALNEGEVVLLYRPKKKFVQAETPENGYEEYEPPVYRDISEYYLKIGEKPATLIKLRKKVLLKSIGDKESILKPFIKKHKLDLRKEADVLLLLNYYNALQNKRGAHVGGEVGIG